MLGGIGLAGLAIFAFWDRPGAWPVEHVITRSNNPFCFGADGRSLIVSVQGQAGQSFVAVDLESGREQAIPRSDLFFGDHFFGPDRSPDGRLLLQRSVSGEVRVLDARTGTEVRRLAAESSPVAAVFAPDGGSVLVFDGPSGHCDGVRTWDLATGAVTRRPLGQPPGLTPGPLRSYASLWLPSPDGRILAYDEFPVGIQLWDVATDRPLGGPLPPPTTQTTARFFSALSFTPDGRFLLSGQPDGRVEVWDVARRVLSRVLTVQGSDHSVDFVVPSPDGRTMLVHSWPVVAGPVARGLELVRNAVVRREEDETVLIDLATGRRLARTSGGQLPAYSPDGRSVAIGHRDRITIHRVPTPTTAARRSTPDREE